MYQNKTFLAIIPARGGSKRLPRKNVLDLHGKPLMGWSIEAGLKSKYIDKVIVTSDDVEILDIAKDAMVEVIRRPTELASDTSTTFDAIKHTINSIEKYNYIVICHFLAKILYEFSKICKKNYFYLQNLVLI